MDSRKEIPQILTAQLFLGHPYYFSDSDNDIDTKIQHSIDNEIIKRKKQNRRKRFHYAHTMIRMMLLRKSMMMEYGAKHIPILPTKENGFIIAVIKLNDVGNNVQLVFIFYTIARG